VGQPGPAQLTSPDAALKGLGQTRPKMYWAGAQQTLLLIWARSGPKGNIDGPEPDWPREEKNKCWARISLAQRHIWCVGRGNYFSPSPHACRTLICMQERTNKKCKQWRGRRTYLARRRRRWSECFASGAVVEAGAGVVAHGRRLQAAVLLFQTVEGKVTALPFSSVCLPLLSFSVVSLYPPGLLSSFLPRFKLFLPLRLSLSVVPFLFGSFSLLGSFSVSLCFLSVRSPPSAAASWRCW